MLIGKKFLQGNFCRYYVGGAITEIFGNNFRGVTFTESSPSNVYRFLSSQPDYSITLNARCIMLCVQLGAYQARDFRLTVTAHPGLCVAFDCSAEHLSDGF